MAKTNSPIRRLRGRQQPSLDSKPMVTVESAESMMTTQLMSVFLSANQVLKEDFGFSAEQLVKFQELLQLRMEINRIKK